MMMEEDRDGVLMGGSSLRALAEKSPIPLVPPVLQDGSGDEIVNVMFEGPHQSGRDRV